MSNRSTESNVSLSSQPFGEPDLCQVNASPLSSSGTISPSPLPHIEQEVAPGKRKNATDDLPGLSKKAKADLGYKVDAMILKSLSDMDETFRSQIAEDSDSDSLFCKSLIKNLQGPHPRENRIAKIKIQEVLFNLEFSGD